jgi:hypothetical protein
MTATSLAVLQFLAAVPCRSGRQGHHDALGIESAANCVTEACPNDSQQRADWRRRYAQSPDQKARWPASLRPTRRNMAGRIQLSAAQSGADLYGPPLVAIALDPDSTLSPVTTWCQLRIGRWRRVSRPGRGWRITGGRGRIVTRRGRWRRAVGYGATDNRAHGDAA